MINRQVVSVSLPKPSVKKLEKLSKMEGKSRSQFIRELIENYEIDSSLDKIFKWGQETGKKFNIKSEEDVLRIIND